MNAHERGELHRVVRSELSDAIAIYADELRQDAERQLGSRFSPKAVILERVAQRLRLTLQVRT